MPSKRPDSGLQPRKLRLACDLCHTVKVRCSGGKPCEKCRNAKTQCHYSYAAKLGKPKGSLNKKTLAKLASASFTGNHLKIDTTKDVMQHHDREFGSFDTYTFNSPNDGSTVAYTPPPPPPPLSPDEMGILDWEFVMRPFDGDLFEWLSRELDG